MDSSIEKTLSLTRSEVGLVLLAAVFSRSEPTAPEIILVTRVSLAIVWGFDGS